MQVLVHAFMVLVLLALSFTASAQVVLFNETFDNNHRQWSIGRVDKGRVLAVIEDGVYELSVLDDEYSCYFDKDVELPADSNWRIMMKIRQTSGDKRPFGLRFMGKPGNDRYELTVTVEQRVRVSRVVDNVFEDIIPWSNCKAVKPRNEWNVLEVRKEGDAVACFVNGQYVIGYTASYLKALGTGVGPILFREQDVEVDEILVETLYRPPLDVVADADATKIAVSLGPAINTAADELVDCISPDGSMLVFSRYGHPENIGVEKRRDIWISQKDANGNWSPPEHLPQPVNTSNENFALAISQDLNTLYLMGLYNGDGTSTPSGGISISQRTDSGWSMPQPLIVDGYYNYSLTVNCHLTPDGSVLIFSLDRSDTHGGNDLYVCFRKQDGSYTAPKNMGSVLNTIGSDVAPFIAPDGKTLFFSSDGHTGYLGRDLFVSTRLDDSWLNWSPPKNLGRPINSKSHDSFLNISAKGDVAYFSSTHRSVGASDIFTIELPKAAKPEAVFIVRGRVIDAESGAPVAAKVAYEDLVDGLPVGTANPNQATGEYQLSLAKGRLFGIRAEADGYFPLSESLDARELAEYREVQKDLYLIPLKKNTAFRLNNVFFDHGSFDLRLESYLELERLSELLSAHPDYRIEISGHTDNVGSPENNKVLSQNRAQSVANHLITLGVETARITVMGYGETKPVKKNDTEEGRQMNRRVEFTILQ